MVDQLPHSFKAEQEVLAAVLIQPECLAELLPQLQQADFYVSQHQAVWVSMAECHDRHGRLDLVLLQQTAQDTGQWTAMGQTRVLSELLDRSGLTSHLPRYVQILQSKALQRRLVEAGRDMEDLGRSDMDDDERIAQADSVVRQVYQSAPSNGLSHGRDGVDKHTELVTQALEGTRPPGLKTGLWCLDTHVGGLQPGWHILVMAASGVGKSAFAINNLALQCARAGQPVAIFTLEMTNGQVMGRLVAAQSGVPFHVQTRGRMDDRDRERYEKAVPVVRQLPIYVDEGEGLTLSALSARTKALAYQTGGLGMVVLDYLQLMEVEQGPKRAFNRSEEIAQITRTLKRLAKELECVVVTLSQPTAEGARADRDLTLADAKGAQSIGADVDMALILNKNQGGAVKLNVAKFRHGPPAVFQNGAVKWNGARMVFEDNSL